MKNILLIFVLFISDRALSQTIEVTAGKVALVSPIAVKIKFPDSKKSGYYLVDLTSGKKIPAQRRDRGTLVFIPSEPILPGTIKRFELKRANGKPTQSGITVSNEKDGLAVKVNGKPLFFYNSNTIMPPPDSPDFYKRSGFIHPLYSPGGEILTDDFPAGHAHQHAIFSAWVNTSFRNKSVDFWNQHNKTGTVEHNRIVSVTTGPVYTELLTELSYKSFNHGTVLTEQWKIVIYPYSDYFLFDLQSIQKNVTTDTLFLKPYHYGGMAFRGSREWNPDDKQYFKSKWHILTSEGIRDSTANGTHARWVYASGKVNGKEVGATVFNHPDNFRYPQAIRVHPSMPYWCFAPVVDGGFFIPPSGVYISSFRYFVHQSLPDNTKIDELQQEWSTPPSVRAIGIAYKVRR